MPLSRVTGGVAQGVVKGSEMKSVGTHVADGSPSISVYTCIQSAEDQNLSQKEVCDLTFGQYQGPVLTLARGMGLDNDKTLVGIVSILVQDVEWLLKNAGLATGREL